MAVNMQRMIGALTPQALSQMVLVFGFCVLPGSTYAQLPIADLTRIVPRVVRAGESVEVNLVGQNLDQVTELRFTHPGISATSVTLPADEFHPEPRQQDSRFTVTAAKDVPPGIYEARAVGFFGYSTSRPFVIAAADSSEIVCDGKNKDADSALQVPVNSVVSGEVPNRGIHWFRFSAKGGQRVLIEVTAERIDSRLDSQLVLYESGGSELKRNRDTFGRDPFLEVRPQNDTDYVIALSDILYRGGAEHFYRLSISTKPHIDFIWPPTAEPGSTQEFTVYGRNLPGGSNSGVTVNGDLLESKTVTITLPKATAVPIGHFPGQPRQGILPGFNYSLDGSNTVRIGFATAPVVTEDSVEDVQEVSVPVEIAGRFDQPNDEDSYRFVAQAGKTYFVDVIADRMASPVDPHVIVEKIVKSDDGTETVSQVAENDDVATFFSVDGKDSINPDTNDSAVSFTTDQDGKHQVTILNQLGNGGAGHIYRLAIREQTPDFQLLATTERPLPTNRTGYSVTPHLRKGARWGIRILCPRQDNFEGDIVVTAEDLPDGVTAKPLTLSGDTDRGVLIVCASADAAAWSGDIRIVGRATIGERQILRDARFASLVWGHIFADSIRVRSRLTERVPLSVNGFEEAPVIIETAEEKLWSVEVGSKLQIPVKLIDNGSRSGSITIEPHGLRGMLRSPPTINIAEKESEGTLEINFTRNGNFEVEPGRYQFALLGTGVTKYRRNERAVELAKQEQQRFEELVMVLTRSADAAKGQVEKTKQALEAAKQALKDAEGDDVKVTLKMAADAAKVNHDKAIADSKAADDKVKTANRLKAQAEKTVTSKEASAAEKSTKFAAWSELITVEVNPAPERK